MPPPLDYFRSSGQKSKRKNRKKSQPPVGGEIWQGPTPPSTPSLRGCPNWVTACEQPPVVARTAGDCGDGCVGRCGHLPGARLRRLCPCFSAADIAALQTRNAAFGGLWQWGHAGGLGSAACLVRWGCRWPVEWCCWWHSRWFWPASGRIWSGSRLCFQSILSGYEGLAHYPHTSTTSAGSWPATRPSVQISVHDRLRVLSLLPWWMPRRSPCGRRRHARRQARSRAAGENARAKAGRPTSSATNSAGAAP